MLKSAVFVSFQPHGAYCGASTDCFSLWWEWFSEYDTLLVSMKCAPHVQLTPQHEKLSLAQGFWGPKGALFYQRLQCCSKWLAALLCNSLVKMNGF